MTPSTPRRPAGRNGKGKGRCWGPPGLGPAPRGGGERGRPPSAVREAETVRALLGPAGKQPAEGRAVRRNPRRWGRLCGEQNAEAASRGTAERGVPPGRPHGAVMSSDFESYEQDFAVLTADITGRIGRVPKLLGDEKKQMVANIEKQLEEARELLEQMELEVREIPPQSRGMYSSRMRSYKQEMGKLEADFKRSRIAYSDEVRNELLGDDGNSSENQRAHLLDNTERLERSSRRLEAGYQIAVETEQIGQEMLENLSHDREKIQRARERLRETDANLGKSSRILTGMLRRIIQNRILIVVLAVFVILTTAVAIFFSIRGR
ncbi:vesicle transport through interaction with t-SNAREs homolog 1A isoform X1 [Excalfactoria chinensis]|uniref:vesicle transport through interaction with t-SNAREs homolog 1A isoform X1 n=2 Tax=Excalfactoria chinensis TaxID=46218 RepID=UPI003B3AF3E8